MMTARSQGLKRGDLNPVTGLFFWGVVVKKTGKRSNQWVTAEKLADRRKKLMANVTAWQKANPEKMKVAQRKLNTKRRSRNNELMRAWKKRNREKANGYARKYYNENELEKLRTVARSGLRRSLSIAGLQKRERSMQALGCTPQFLRSYLQARFLPGMTWENHGKWHIDHIIPLASATDRKGISKLCHYTNLQPLWAAENIKKKDKQPKQLELL